MPELKLILLLVIAHLLADFSLQSQSMSDKKERKIFTKYHVYHVLIVGILSYLLSFDPGFWIGALVLTVIHLFTDMLKSWLLLKNNTRNYFFLDQFIHMVSVILIVFAYSGIFEIDFLFDFSAKTVAIIAAFIFCSKPSNIFIKYLFLAFSIQTPVDNPDKPDDQSLPNAGKLIGVVERYMALALIIIGQFQAVGLIIAAKSILRFSRTQKSEYVLVGTLLSFGIAMFAGILISLIN